MNLILAIFWGVLSIGLALLFVIRGDRVEIARTGIPFVYLTVFLFCYNMLRWIAIRVSRFKRAKATETAARERHRPRERNPDFDFSDD